MLFFFTGNDSYSLRQEIQKWKNAFIEKHGDFGLTHIKDISEIDTNFLSETLFSQALFGGIKLTILEIHSSPKQKEDEGEDAPSIFPGNTSTLSYLESSLENIPEEHRVLIAYFSPDKRTTLFKKLKSLAQETKLFEHCENPEELFTLIQKKYKDRISSEALRKIIEYKWARIEKIIPEIEKLSIVYTPIEKVHIETHIIPEFEESIFVLVQALLSRERKQVFDLMEKILQGANVYLLYHSLLSNLRLHRYILFLQEKGYSSLSIKEILSLWNRGFLVDRKNQLSAEKIKILYEKLCLIDIQMKSGKLLGSEDNDFRFEMERVFLETLS